MAEEIKHLTDDEVIQYWVLRPEDRASSPFEQHRVSCTACDQRVRNVLNDSVDIALAIGMELSIEPAAECSVDDVAAYVDGALSKERSTTLEEHLIRCNSCLCLSAQRIGGIKPPMGVIHTAEVDSLLDIMKLNQRHKNLTERVAGLSRDLARQGIAEIVSGVQSLLRKTFSLPTPKFAPVFGEETPSILGPFGKTRYPILFAWQIDENADQYIVSIDGYDARFTTGESSIELTSDMLELDAGGRYMWQLDLLVGGQSLEQITGFFSLATTEEEADISALEREVKELEPPEDRYLLIGEILERKGLFVDAIKSYKRSYELEPFTGLAYRIAFCYEQLQLEELRDEWNRKI